MNNESVAAGFQLFELRLAGQTHLETSRGEIG